MANILVTKNNLGGLGKGIENFGEILGKTLSKIPEQKRFDEIFNPQVQQTKNFEEDEEFFNNFLEMTQNYENDSGELLDSNQLNFLWENAVSSAQKPSQNPGEPRKYDQRQLAELTRINPAIASIIQRDQTAREGFEQKKSLAREGFEQKKSLAREERAFKKNTPYREYIDKLRKSIPQKEISLMRIRDALASGDVKSLRNFFADKSGNEYFRSAGLNDLNSAVKEFFLADMQSMPAGTRLNQFLEKNLLGALESGAKSPSSNQKIAEYQQFTIDLGKKEIEIYDKLSKKYEMQGQDPPDGVRRQAEKQIDEYISKRQKELAQVYTEINGGKIKSSDSIAINDAKKKIGNLPAGHNNVWMLTPSGEIKKVDRSQVKAAEAAGGRLVK